MYKSISRLEKALSEYKPARGAWNRGVKEYAIELLDVYKDRAEYEEREAATSSEFKEWLYNGAANWTQYSWGGCSLIYDYDIAKRLCNPTELKRTHNGYRKPNNREEWLDTQARALHQAAKILCILFENTRSYDDEGQPVPLF